MKNRKVATAVAAPLPPPWREGRNSAVFQPENQYLDWAHTENTETSEVSFMFAASVADGWLWFRPVVTFLCHMHSISPYAKNVVPL